MDDTSGLSVSDHAACAVSSGRAECFALSDWSLLSDFGAQPAKAFDLGLEDVRQLVLGSRYLCALHGGGQVRCWGTVGEFPTRNEPSKKLVAPKLQGVEELVGGHRHVCARHDGRVTCWGMNTYGELGHGEAGDDMGPSDVTGLEDATGLVADFGTTCALRASGQVACWGMGHHGELGTLVGASRELLRAPLAP